MFPMSFFYDDRQTRLIQRDEKNWKEGEKMKERKIKSSKCCVCSILNYFAIRELVLKKEDEKSGGRTWMRSIFLWRGG
jgi:hypothetical protein